MFLREMIEDDLSIFLDFDDMAAEHTVCLPGDPVPRKIAVVIDNGQGQQNALKSQGGTYEGSLLFFARTADVVGVDPGSMLQFDDRPYSVVSAVEEDGMTQVTLQAGAGGF